MSEERSPGRGTVGFIPPEAAPDATTVKCSPNQDGYALGMMSLQMFATAPLKSDNMLMNAVRLQNVTVRFGGFVHDFERRGEPLTVHQRVHESEAWLRSGVIVF